MRTLVMRMAHLLYLASPRCATYFFPFDPVRPAQCQKVLCDLMPTILLPYFSCFLSARMSVFGVFCCCCCCLMCMPKRKPFSYFISNIASNVSQTFNIYRHTARIRKERGNEEKECFEYHPAPAKNEQPTNQTHQTKREKTK